MIIAFDYSCDCFRSRKDCHRSNQLPSNDASWRRSFLHFQLPTWIGAAWKISVVQPERNLGVSSLFVERQEHYVPVARDFLTKQLDNDVSTLLVSNETKPRTTRPL